MFLQESSFQISLFTCKPFLYENLLFEDEKSSHFCFFCGSQVASSYSPLFSLETAKPHFLHDNKISLINSVEYWTLASAEGIFLLFSLCILFKALSHRSFNTTAGAFHCISLCRPPEKASFFNLVMTLGWLVCSYAWRVYKVKKENVNLFLKIFK